MPMELVYSSCGLNYIRIWGEKWLASNEPGKGSLMTDCKNLYIAGLTL